MAQAIDTLEVIFTANMAPLTACLGQISAQLAGVSGASDIADAGLRNMAASLDFGMAALKRSAGSAGQAVGAAFANGIRSKKGAVDQAVKYLTQAAMDALRTLIAPGAGADDAATVPGSTAQRFDAASMEKAAAAGGSGEVIDVTVPINVDGIRLGEACIRGINTVSRISGRAHLKI